MIFTKLDWICLAIIVAFGFIGFRKGAIGALIGLVGLIGSFIAAWIASPWVTEKIMSWPVIQSTLITWIGKIDTPQNILLEVSGKIMEMVVFVIIVIIVNIAIKKIKDLSSKVDGVPIIGTANHLIGMGLGALSGLIILMVIVGIVYYSALYTHNTAIQDGLSGSLILRGFLLLTKK